MYWQRHGFCSLILVQQTCVGGRDDVIALAQGLSCAGLQLTAFATSTLLANTSTSNAHIAMFIKDGLMFKSLLGFIYSYLLLIFGVWISFVILFIDKKRVFLLLQSPTLWTRLLCVLEIFWSFPVWVIIFWVIMS